MQETEAVEQLLDCLQAMLSGRLSFVEGAQTVLAVKCQVDGISERDSDFDPFVMISSETDHLPIGKQIELWHPDVRGDVRQKLQNAEDWARTFAPDACRNLIDRFAQR